jgi:acyl-CoA synthetase (AMP-forming)/AMP-acid ligase II
MAITDLRRGDDSGAAAVIITPRWNCKYFHPWRNDATLDQRGTKSLCCPPTRPPDRGSLNMLAVPDLGFKATLGECLRRASDRHADRDFIVMPDRRMTYGEAEGRSRKLAKALLELGVGKGTRVGIFDTYSPEWVVAWLATIRIGALAMPFSSIYKPAELGTAMRLGDVHTLLAPTSFLGRNVEALIEEAVPGLGTAAAGTLFLPSMPHLRQVWLWGPTDRRWARAVDLASPVLGSTVDDCVFDAIEAEVQPADWAQVTYTSGSSALPKGVVHSHGAIVRVTAAPWSVAAGGPPVGVPEPEEPETTFCAFPFFWIGGTLVLGRALVAGNTVCCLPKFEPAAALDLIEREGATSVRGWSTLLQSLRADPTFAQRDLSGALALAFQPGAGMPEGPLPGIPAHRSMSELVGTWAGAERRAVDPKTGEVLPDLIEGELTVRGFGLMQAYYKREREETYDADGWLHTGDRVYLADNRVYFVGRFFEMVKSQGANVSPREVETVLERWPKLLHAFVFGTPHPTLEEEVTAVVIPVPEETVTEREVREHAAASLSSFKVPTRVVVVADESDVPWLGSGKPDKLQLRTWLLSGKLHTVDSSSTPALARTTGP